MLCNVNKYFHQISPVWQSLSHFQIQREVPLSSLSVGCLQLGSSLASGKEDESILPHGRVLRAGTLLIYTIPYSKVVSARLGWHIMVVNPSEISGGGIGILSLKSSSSSRFCSLGASFRMQLKLCVAKAPGQII